MSHAEYAPKRLPVLPRLVKALRRIPAVSFAFAKLSALLRRRTNDEQIVAGDSVAPGADAIAADAIVSDTVAREPVATEAADTDTAEAETPVVGLVGNDPVEADATETHAVETEFALAEGIATDGAEEAPDEVAAHGTDEITPAAVDPDHPAGETTEFISDEPIAVEPIALESPAVEPAEIDVTETVPIASEAAASEVESEAVESVAAETEAVGSIALPSDDVAPPDTKSEAFVAPEVDVADLDVLADPAPTDTIEIVADGTPAAALALAETEAEAKETGAVEAAPIETITVEPNHVPSPVATSNDFSGDADDPPPAATDVVALAAAKPEDRETLIRRRWRETGIMMWNPRVHGSGHSALCIQGSVALLPPKPGETMPCYDRLEFKLMEGLITCEGVVVDPPERLKSHSFARAA